MTTEQPIYLVVKGKKSGELLLYKELSLGYKCYSFSVGWSQGSWNVKRKTFLSNYKILLTISDLREAQTFLIEEQFKNGNMAGALYNLSQL